MRFPTPPYGPYDLITDAVQGWHISSYIIRERHINTGEVYSDRLNAAWGTRTGIANAIPDTNTEIAHNLGRVPQLVEITEYYGGTEAQVFLVSTTISSFIVRAETNKSGVEIQWFVMA
jgi:hypothetical protein